MKSKEKRSSRAPRVDTTGLEKRKLLEARLLCLDAQIRNFGVIRDQLTAAGKDAAAYYRQTLKQRAEVFKSLKKLAPQDSANFPGPGNSTFQHGAGTLLGLPIASARFNRDLGVFGFGSSGIVQAGVASEGVNLVAHGSSSGELTPIPSPYAGQVQYVGFLRAGNQEEDAEYDPSGEYFWLRNWTYLIPFPPPSMQSRLTYRFSVDAYCSVFREGSGTAMVFASVGETGNLSLGTDVRVNIDAGWPLFHDLTQPADPLYKNGRYGSLDGLVTVQRSFMVSGGCIPAVAVVVGVIVALTRSSLVNLGTTGYCSISIGSGNEFGRIEYSYEPQLVVHQ